MRAFILFCFCCSCLHGLATKQELLKYARKRASQNITAATARGLTAENLKSLARRRASRNITAAAARGLTEERMRSNHVDTHKFDPNIIEIISRFHYSEQELINFINHK